MAKMNPILTAVAYMRCSGKGQVDGDTWDRQSAAITAFGDSQRIEILKSYREEAVPGKSDVEDRPAFQEMITDLLANGCRTIVVESLDRLAREYRIQEQLIIYVASKGLSLFAANTGENITAAMMGDPMRRALVQIQGIFAELDKNMLVTKLRKARERKRDRGERAEGPPPYGHTPDERAVLRIIYEMWEQKHSMAQIAEKLNSDGIKTRYQKEWKRMQVYRCLSRNAPADVTTVLRDKEVPWAPELSS